MELDITDINLDGDGLATVEDRVVAVPFTIPGERVDVRLVRGRDGATVGEVVRILAPSPHRVTAPCRHFGPCGGCAWQHIAYTEQLRLKQRLLEQLLDEAIGGRAGGSKDRLGGSKDPPYTTIAGGSKDPPYTVRPTLPTPAAPQAVSAAQAGDAVPWHYRDKVSFVFGPGSRGQGLVMGHYRRGSRSIVPVSECPVHVEAGNAFAFGLRDVLVRARVPGATPDGEEGVARHVVARVSERSGELLGTLVVTENVRALRRVTSEVQKAMLPGEPGTSQPRSGFHLNVHDRPGSMLFGRETRRLFGLSEIREQVAGVSYLVSPTAFFQTNVRAAEVLVGEVLDALAGSGVSRVLDLYAGVGLFALPLARQGRTVTAVEENRHAIASAASALRLNRVPEQACRLIASRVEDAIPRIGNTPWDAVVLDPPRQGCPPPVLEWLLGSLRPPVIVYVSCNPEALARDLALVPGSGYRFDRIQPIDMFPHTAHVETVAVLSRSKQ